MLIVSYICLIDLNVLCLPKDLKKRKYLIIIRKNIFITLSIWNIKILIWESIEISTVIWATKIQLLKSIIINKIKQIFFK